MNQRSTVAGVLNINFPPMPHTLFEILKMRTEKQPNLERLIGVVQNDPVIAANVLRRINSAYYSLRQEVSQVNKALTLLGYKEVFGLVLAAAVRQAFAFKGIPEAKDIFAHIMKTSAATATFARHLTQNLGMMFQETAFSAGLLHQMGRLILLNVVSATYVELWKKTSPLEEKGFYVSPRPEMEQFVFDTDYILVGGAMAKHWSLPEDLSTVIQYHLVPEKVDKLHLRNLAYVVAISREAAAMLFEDSEDALEDSVLLNEIAEMRYRDVNDLAEFMYSIGEDVAQFSEALMQE